ncbi:hypothetical protein BCR35DRAFT_325252 [Leucosporidium creatinivorum]|uniref:PH domain-containing protein n=1 Tax=Leucosporidium creatinivorum TaxID=106004 RepID=A0A1Y2F762_9BASI|nr:hypothetical protein BCR35DRAFT_325252 [Leucosporidium creatinivorum]
MYRWSSSSSVPQVSKSPAPSSPAPGAAPPTEPLPQQGTRPHDILINRCHEVKRITKSLASYFDGLAQAHHSHSQVLAKLSAPSVIQTPLPESSLFIPAASTTSTAAGVGTPGAGGGGWAELLVQTKETNKNVAESHAELAKIVSKDVVVPLKKLRGEMKAHIGNLDKEVSKLAEIVLKERDISLTHLTALTNSLSPSTSPSTSPAPPSSHGPVAPTATSDPVLLRSAVETQLKVQIAKENDLLAAVKVWTEKTQTKEQAIWAEVNRCWTVWEQANSNMLLGNQQRSMILSAGVDCVGPDTEWNHFLTLNHVIPASTPARSIDNLDYPGHEDPMTVPLKEGMLERQKRIMKSWTTGYYLLTPQGHLHTYPTSSAPLPSPSSSLYLPHCTLGPMPTPEASTKGRQLEAMFTIEDQSGTKHVLRAKSWEELGGWWEGLVKFTKPAPIPDISTLDTDAQAAAGIDSQNGGEDQDEDEREAEAQRAAAREAAQREMTSEEREAQQERERQEVEDGGDIGASAKGKSPTGPPPALPPRAVPPPPSTPPSLPPRTPHTPEEADIGFPLESPKSPPILTDSPDAPPADARGSGVDMSRVPSL